VAAYTLARLTEARESAPAAVQVEERRERTLASRVA